VITPILLSEKDGMNVGRTDGKKVGFILEAFVGE
jgi:hypothetical protein